jgi:tRNA nucleotidyltransferase (CCA-adding enzyme)
VFMPKTLANGTAAREIQTLRHTEFYANELTDNDKLIVRVLKAFFKQNGVYGAEQGGITGVAIEELVRTYHLPSRIFDVLNREPYQLPELQDPCTTRKRNLLASLNYLRLKQLRELLSTRLFLLLDVVEGYEPLTEQRWRDRIPSNWRILTFARAKDVAHDFTSMLSEVEGAIQNVVHYDREISYEYDVRVFDERICVAFRGTPETLSPVKIVKGAPKEYRTPEADESFKRRNENATQIVEDAEGEGQLIAVYMRTDRNTNEILEKMIRFFIGDGFKETTWQPPVIPDKKFHEVDSRNL